MNNCKELLENTRFPSYLEFSRQIGVSELTLHRLDVGLIDSTSLGELKKIATGLNISLDNLIDFFSRGDSSVQVSGDKLEDTDNEKSYAQGEKDLIFQEFQQSTIAILESLLLQLPTVIKAVENNPSLPASRVIPLLKPLNSLLSEWEVSAIAPVGSIVPYNPQEHQIMNEGEVLEEGENVEIRYVGYRQRDNLLYRAKVSPPSTDF